MTRIGIFLIAAAFLAFGFASPAQAESLVVDGGWQDFVFGGQGSSWDRTFNYVSAQPTKLTVTDAFNAGDRFGVFIGGSVNTSFATSVPTAIGPDIGADYDAAAADPRWSTGMIQLPPGSFLIRGIAIDSPFGAGRAAIRADTIPEPSLLALLLAGGTAFVVRRRRKSTS
ncbi:MAG: PEP-CTERM sorting domain-containing protein [Planctomycetota bacterium]|jgi:hypothetical protein